MVAVVAAIDCGSFFSSNPYTGNFRRRNQGPVAVAALAGRAFPGIHQTHRSSVFPHPLFEFAV